MQDGVVAMATLLYLLVPCAAIPIAIWIRTCEAHAALEIRNYKLVIREILFTAFTVGVLSIIDVLTVPGAMPNHRFVALLTIVPVGYSLVNYVRYAEWTVFSKDAPPDSNRVLEKLDDWVVWVSFGGLAWCLGLMVANRHWFSPVSG